LPLISFDVRRHETKLALSRKVNQGIVIGDQIYIKVIRITIDAVKIGIAAPKELADDGRLRHIFLRKRRHDALNVGPFLADQRVEYLARGLDKEILIVIRMHESDQRIHSFVQVAVAWCKAITEYMQNPEVNLIGAMRISRMAFWFDVSRVVVQ